MTVDETRICDQYSAVSVRTGVHPVVITHHGLHAAVSLRQREQQHALHSGGDAPVGVERPEIEQEQLLLSEGLDLFAHQVAGFIQSPDLHREPVPAGREVVAHPIVDEPELRLVVRGDFQRRVYGLLQQERVFVAGEPVTPAPVLRRLLRKRP